MIASVDVRRGSAVGSARTRSRRDSKLNQTKKQLELLNELYRDNYGDQIVVLILCRKGIRRNWSTRKQRYIQLWLSIASKGNSILIKLLEGDISGNFQPNRPFLLRKYLASWTLRPEQGEKRMMR